MADLSHLVCWNSHRGFLKYASYTGCVGPSRFGESQADRHIKGCGPKRNYIERSVGALHVFGPDRARCIDRGNNEIVER
jgi:hypothetical protein